MSVHITEYFMTKCFVVVIVSLSHLTVSALSTLTIVHLRGVKGQVKFGKRAKRKGLQMLLLNAVDVRCLTGPAKLLPGG